jgi:ABC-type uncharacterized transport system permease subunit
MNTHELMDALVRSVVKVTNEEFSKNSGRRTGITEKIVQSVISVLKQKENRETIIKKVLRPIVDDFFQEFMYHFYSVVAFFIFILFILILMIFLLWGVSKRLQ